jgi:hypothetical protein
VFVGFNRQVEDCLEELQQLQDLVAVRIGAGRLHPGAQELDQPLIAVLHHACDAQPLADNVHRRSGIARGKAIYEELLLIVCRSSGENRFKPARLGHRDLRSQLLGIHAFLRHKSQCSPKTLGIR